MKMEPWYLSNDGADVTDSVRNSSWRDINCHIYTAELSVDCMTATSLQQEDLGPAANFRARKTGLCGNERKVWKRLRRKKTKKKIFTAAYRTYRTL